MLGAHPLPARCACAAGAIGEVGLRLAGEEIEDEAGVFGVALDALHSLEVLSGYAFGCRVEWLSPARRDGEREEERDGAEKALQGAVACHGGALASKVR